MKKKKSKVSKRSSANFRQSTVKSDKISDFRYDSKPAVLQSSSVSKESPADRELKNLMSKRVFRSDPGAVSRSNSNKRRYQ